MAKRKSRKYCIVTDCPNTDLTPGISFFSLPKNDEKRMLWLHIIGRLDLAQRENLLKPGTYLLCSAHFKKSDIKISTSREPMKDAIPTLVGHSQILERTCERSTQTEAIYLEEPNSIEIQYIPNEVIVETRGTQTRKPDRNNDGDSPRKKKMKAKQASPLKTESHISLSTEIKVEPVSESSIYIELDEQPLSDEGMCSEIKQEPEAYSSTYTELEQEQQRLQNSCTYTHSEHDPLAESKFGGEN